MSFRSTRSSILSNLHQIPGWKTDRKIVVFESDDWGSIRMPSLEVLKKLKNGGFNVDDHYNRYDSLASEHDLELLFDLLLSFKDYYGRSPALSANCVVANPNFNKIRDHDFREYFYEKVPETLAKSKGCSNSFNLWKQGLTEGIFIPQFHGREHLNINLWMRALSENHAETRTAFDFGFWGHQTGFKFAKRKHFLAAFDFSTEKEIAQLCAIIQDGITIFKDLFGHKPESFVAPNYIWNSEIEKSIHSEGILCIQSQRKQVIPIAGMSGYSKKSHYTGEMNENGQLYFVRNANFEPSSDPDMDWISRCLRDIARAFFWKKPAIISTHRVNYIGAIVASNRDRNLIYFRNLLNEILKRWPDVEFVSSGYLRKLVLNN